MYGCRSTISDKADRHKSHAPSNPVSDGLTDQQTDGPTDRVAYRVACTRLKIPRLMQQKRAFLQT